MNKPKVFLFFYLLLPLCINIQTLAAESSKEELAAQNYGFQGLQLGATTSDLLAKFPEVQDSTNPKDRPLGLKTYGLAGIPNITAIFFYFFENQLYAIRLGYDVDTVARLGGWQNIAGKVVDKYGKADASSDGDQTKDPDTVASFFWKFASVDRFIELTVKNQFMYVQFTDINLYSKMQQKIKDNTDLGF